MLAQYYDDTLAEGYAVQNQIYSSLSTLLMREAKDAQEDAAAAMDVAKAISLAKTPAYQADLTAIQNSFMLAVKEIKKEIGSDLAAAQTLSKQVTEQIFSELMKGQDALHPTITPEQLADAVTGSVSGMDGVNQVALSDFNAALVSLLKDVPPNTDDGTNE